VAGETFTLAERTRRPSFPAEFCLGPDDPRLPEGYADLSRRDLDEGRLRRVIAIRI
jgi:hypothetical protein